MDTEALVALLERDIEHVRAEQDEFTGDRTMCSYFRGRQAQAERLLAAIRAAS